MDRRKYKYFVAENECLQIFMPNVYFLLGIFPQDINKLLGVNLPVLVDVSLVEQFLDVLVRHSSWTLI